MPNTRSANIYARIEPDIKSRAETVLGQLGIPLSNAIGMFLRQIVLQNGIPFEMKLPAPPLLALGALSKDELDAALDIGWQEHLAGKGIPADEVFAELHGEFGV